MGWTVGDHGFEMTLTKKIPRLIAGQLRPWMESWLGANGLKIEEVGSWAVHPGGPKILSAVEEGLMLTSRQLDDSRAILSEFGNMSSPTVLFILEERRGKGVFTGEYTWTQWQISPRIRRGVCAAVERHRLGARHRRRFAAPRVRRLRHPRMEAESVLALQDSLQATHH